MIPRPKALVTALLLLYFTAALWMAFALPPLATPNELLNYEYIQVMRQIRGLPNRGLVDSEVRYTEWHQPPVYYTFAALFGLSVPVPPSVANPPPPLAVAGNPHYLGTPRGNLNPAVHVGPSSLPLLYTSRVAAALLGMLGVAALYTAGRRVYGPAVGLLMASILAFQPTYLHLSGAVNNDMPLTAVAALVMSFAVILLAGQQGRRGAGERGSAAAGGRSSAVGSLAARYFLLGLLCAAAILTKANGVFVLVIPVVVLAALLLGGRATTDDGRQTTDGRPLTADRRGPSIGDTRPISQSPNLPISFLCFAAGLLPLWGGWLWLNTVRMRDTLGLSGSLPVGRVLSLSPLDFGHVAPFLPAVWRSYWLDWSAGDVGYGPDWLYAFWLLAAVAMLLGWLRRDTKYEIRDTSLERPSLISRISYLVPSLVARRSSLITLMILLAFLAISYLYFAVKALTVKEAGWMVPEARWWLPGLPMLAWLMAAGYARWWSPPRRRTVACLAAAAVPPIIAFGLLIFHLPGLYPAAERVAAEPPSSPTAPLLSYGPLSLLAAEMKQAVAGGPAPVVLTWRAENDLDVDYTINTQLLAQEPGGWRKLAEHNSFPGQGMNPTRGWQAGDVYRDTLALVAGGPLNGPTLAALQVRVVAGGPAPVLTGSPGAPTGGEPARDQPPTRSGQPIDPPVVATVVVRPAVPLTLPAAGAAPVLFAEAFELAAWSVEPAGDPDVTLWWWAETPPATDYAVFVHLLDAAGNLVAQADGPPNDGLSPTSIWREGDVIRDVHRFPPGTTLPEGGRILVGAYRPDTGERAPATRDGAPLPDNALALP